MLASTALWLGRITQTPHLPEAAMTASHEARLLTLGWQTWAILVIVLALVTLAGVFVLPW